MRKQIAKKSSGKLVKKPAEELEPLKDVLGDLDRSVDWMKRFVALPLSGKNKVLRQNPELLEQLVGRTVPDGEMLIRPLAAEHSSEHAEGEYTFLTVLKPLRDRLIKEYEITTGAEFMLLDVLVLSYYQYIRAASNLHSYTAYGKSYDYETLVRYAQTYLARANEMFLRNLEALRQMKAAPFVIKIEQAGQVNVGEKQVNVAGRPAPALGEIIIDDGKEGKGLPAGDAATTALPEPDDTP